MKPHQLDKLLADIVKPPRYSFITCPMCHGDRFDIVNRLCCNCGGDGCILVTDGDPND